MFFELKTLIHQFVIGVLMSSRHFMRFMLFFNEISISCQRNKKWYGLKQCDWMRSFRLKEECAQRPSPAGKCSVDRGQWAGGASGGPEVRPGNPRAQVGKCHLLASAGGWTLCFLVKGSISIWKTVRWSVKIIPFRGTAKLCVNATVLLITKQ